MESPVDLEAALRQGDREALGKVYLRHREAFLSFGRRYTSDEALLQDCYQEATIALFHQLASEQTKLERGGLKTYLFSIGKFKLFDRLKQEQRMVPLGDETEREAPFVNPTELTEQQVLMARHFDTLGDRCKEVLRLFYYRGLSIKEIVETAGYKDENTVKSQKSRCLKTLRERIKQQE